MPHFFSQSKDQMGRWTLVIGALLPALVSSSCWLESVQAQQPLPEQIDPDSAAENGPLNPPESANTLPVDLNSTPVSPNPASESRNIPPAKLEDYAKIFSQTANRNTEDPDPPLGVLDETPSLLAETDITPRELRSQYGDQIHVLHEWLDQLGSTRFARREYATHALFQQGFRIVPLLRRRLYEGADAETKLRLTQLLESLEGEYYESVRTAFLRGQDGVFPGWELAKQLMGDSPPSRRIYADICRQSLEIASALDRTTKERSTAIQSILMRAPPGNRTDLTAVLLAAADPAYKPSLSVEADMLSRFRMAEATELRIRNDSRQFSENLMGAFLLKTSIEKRDEWLHVGTDRQLSATALLAQQTLTETDHPIPLAAAMASLVRFERKEAIEDIARFLDDSRALGNGWVQSGRLLEVRVSDVAMAAIGSLLGKRTDEIGFPLNLNHPTFGLDVTRLGFPADDPSRALEKRKQIRKNVDDLMRENRLGQNAVIPQITD